jgi:PAS domain S-box-containing protein
MAGPGSDKSAHYYRALVENSRDIIYSYRLGENRGFEYVNEAATSITGYTPEEHYADPDLGLKLVHPDDRHLLETLICADIDTSAAMRLRWVRKDGTIIWTEQLNVLVRDAEGRPVAIQGVARDISSTAERGPGGPEPRALLREAVSESKANGGIVMICASCRKIRGRSGDWMDVEELLSGQGQARLSHGLCPDCCAALKEELG